MVNFFFKLPQVLTADFLEWLKHYHPKNIRHKVTHTLLVDKLSDTLRKQAGTFSRNHTGHSSTALRLHSGHLFWRNKDVCSHENLHSVFIAVLVPTVKTGLKPGIPPKVGGCVH